MAVVSLSKQLARTVRLKQMPGVDGCQCWLGTDKMSSRMSKCAYATWEDFRMFTTQNGAKKLMDARIRWEMIEGG